VNLRPLTPDDMDALTELARVCDETYLDWAPPGWSVPLAPPKWADRYLQHDAWALLGFEGDELIASAAFRSADGVPGVAHVGLVFVHPSRWRQGIGVRMMGLAEDEMRARAYVREQLWTPNGAPAERFYTALGWRLDGRREWHPWVGLEMVGFAKDLAS
jgi:GNAT superfamily N-acetyltransferase